MMYPRLSALRDKFVGLQIMIGPALMFYSGKLIEVNQEFCTLQIYDQSYDEETQYSFPTQAVFSVCVNRPQERVLMAEIAFKKEIAKTAI